MRWDHCERQWDSGWTGGVVLTLLHRHDIRVIIASGMYIRKCWGPTRVMRLELLCVLHLCYWRWSTKLLLEEMEHRVQEYTVAQPLARAKIWREVWQIMESKMEQRQVAQWSARRELSVMDRRDVELARDGASGADFRAYHAYMNPSGILEGSLAFSILEGSLADGSLWRACEDIARNIEGTPSYTAVTDAMRKHKVTLWQGGSCSCVRLARALFQAEQVEATWNEEDWNLLSRMDEGVKAGIQTCGLHSFAAAQRLCELISSASGEPYSMDSLASFLCLGSRCPSLESSSVDLQWPERARPVTIAEDLDIDATTLITAQPQPLARDHGRPQQPTQRSTAQPLPRHHGRLLCMRPLIEFLDMSSHVALRMCGRCAGLSWLAPQPLARDEQLAYWVARFLHVDGPQAVELQRHGMSMGCLTRVLACARDWLDGLDRAVLHSLWRAPLLGALVVVRVALKFEVPKAHLAKALGLYRSLRNLREIQFMECVVVQALPARHMVGDM